VREKGQLRILHPFRVLIADQLKKQVEEWITQNMDVGEPGAIAAGNWVHRMVMEQMYNVEENLQRAHEGNSGENDVHKWVWRYFGEDPVPTIRIPTGS